MREEWRKIIINKLGIEYDFSELYEISNLGRVRSLDKTIIDSMGRKRQFKGMLRSPIEDKDGYLLVSLWKDGKGGMFKIHRLVCEAFLPNPLALKLINHKDENKSNNVVWINEDGSIDYDKSNLEWCDAKYNRNYGEAENKRIESWKQTWCPEQSVRMLETRRKNNCIGSPKYVLQIEPNTEKVKNIYPSTMEAERETNIQHIYRVANGNRNKAGGYKWKYLDDYLADWWDGEMDKIRVN